MLKYLLGILKFLFNPAVSIFSKIDYSSSIDRNAKVNSHTQVYNSTMGKYSYLGRKSVLICADVGMYCSIGDEVKVGLGIHTLSNLSTSPLFTEKHNGTGTSWTDNDKVEPFKRVTVGNDVWIGQNAVILPGVNIGDGAIIGANCVVGSNVEPYTIVIGNPARMLRKRFDDDLINLLLKFRWWDKNIEEINDLIPILTCSDLKRVKKELRNRIV